MGQDTGLVGLLTVLGATGPLLLPKEMDKESTVIPMVHNTVDEEIHTVRERSFHPTTVVPSQRLVMLITG